jgi:hypothetical protein
MTESRAVAAASGNGGVSRGCRTARAHPSMSRHRPASEVLLHGQSGPRVSNEIDQKIPEHHMAGHYRDSAHPDPGVLV